MRQFRLPVPALLFATLPALVAAPVAAFQSAPQDAPPAEESQPSTTVAGDEPTETEAVAQADGDTATKPDQKLVVSGEKEKTVCRNVTAVGSRVPQRVCRTMSTAREDRLATREVMQELQQDGAPLGENDVLYSEAASRVGNESQDRDAAPRL